MFTGLVGTDVGINLFRCDTMGHLLGPIRLHLGNLCAISGPFQRLAKLMDSNTTVTLLHIRQYGYLT